MADNAFKSHAFPGMTLARLKEVAGDTDVFEAVTPEFRSAVLAEIERREEVAAGDYTRATAGERLRAVREGLIK